MADRSASPSRSSGPGLSGSGSSGPPPRVLLKRGMLAVRRGQMDAARTQLDALLAIDPDHEEALLWRVRASETTAEQQRFLQRALDANPDNDWARTQLERLATTDADAPTPTGPADAPAPLTVRALQCPNCAGTVEVLGGAKIKTAVCTHCGSVLGLTQREASILARSTPDVQPAQPITPGMRATFDGTSHLCVGWLRYEGKDDESTWTWDEWLLVGDDGRMHWLTYDKEVGFTLLVETALTRKLTPVSQKIHTASGTATVFERDEARLIALRGEMTWRAQIGNRIRYLDARRGRTIVTAEFSKKEVEVFEGSRVSPRAVWTAFGDQEQLAAYERRVDRRTEARFHGIVALCIAFGFLFAVLFALEGGAQVLKKDARLQPGVALTLGTFDAPVAGETYRIDLRSPTLSHRTSRFTERSSWAWIQALVLPGDTLATSRAWDGRAVVLSASPWREQGRDSDGPWKESDPDAYGVFSIPEAGRYTVEVVMPEHQLTAAQLPLAVTVTVRRGVWLGRWFIIGLLLFSVIAVSCFAFAYSKTH